MGNRGSILFEHNESATCSLVCDQLYHLSDHITRDGASLEDLIDNYCMAVRGGPLGADDEYRIWDEDDGTLYLGKIPVSDWPAYSE